MSNLAKIILGGASAAFAGVLAYRHFVCRSQSQSHVVGNANAWTLFHKHADDLYLGLDLSTQGLKAVLVNRSLQIVNEVVINFARDLPQYNTTDGYIRMHDGLEVLAPSLMFVEALEVALDKLRNEKQVDLSRVVAISNSGQQHGSIWWADGTSNHLKSLDLLPRELAQTSSLTRSLSDSGAFSLPRAPIWMDSSTAQECREIEEHAGGAARVARISGSRAYERFTGAQIRKRIKQQPGVYARTERISLISSMVPTLFLGRYASIDHADGSGMNLMDLQSGDWCEDLLDAACFGTSHPCASELRQKLGRLIPSHSVLGTVSSYFQKRFGFSAACVVVAGSGDNPCAMAGLGLSSAGDLGVSLGTSDTVFAVVDAPNPGVDGHVFRNPVDPGSFMAMVCFKNGSIARQRVRDLVIGHDAATWDAFNELLASDDAQTISTDPKSGQVSGRLGLYYFDPEITPTLNHAVIAHVEFTQDALASEPKLGQLEMLAAEEATAGKFPGVGGTGWHGAQEARAIIESQALSMRFYAERLGLTNAKRIIATGGASQNSSLLQVVANVFDASVFRTAFGSESAAFGSALRAIHGHVCYQRNQWMPFREAIANASVHSHSNGADSADQLLPVTLVSQPEESASDPDSVTRVALYSQTMMPAMRLLQRTVLDRFGDSASLRASS